MYERLSQVVVIKSSKIINDYARAWVHGKEILPHYACNNFSFAVFYLLL